MLVALDTSLFSVSGDPTVTTETPNLCNNGKCW